MDIKIAIPSLGRPDSITTIKNLDLPYETTIFVHNREEYRKYKRYNTNNIVINNVKGVTAARNFILNYYNPGDHILICDDDIKGIFQKVGDEKELLQISGKSLEKLIKNSFKLCQNHNLHLWGLYPVPNHFYMSNKMSNRAFIIGTFTGCIITDLRYDENLKLKEDYDFTMQHIIRDGSILRYDNICVKADHYTKGGCENIRNDIQEKLSKNYLMKKYPKYIKNNPRSENEILMRFPGCKK